MSLKGFHILFIILSVLCAFGFYAWTVFQSEAAESLGVTGLGQGSAVVGFFLTFYGIWFVVKKYKTIIV
jgi:hypothetical protein